ncbi:MAG: bifunctional phosphopantothenoylcysteine decarboxylase/phosphopantothenate--cysteine ligase CoaBC [Bacillota bacterium]
MFPLQKVVLGVTGGIAAYKAAELARLFVKSGADVQVVMTRAATEFIAPLTFQSLTEKPVYTEMYAEKSGGRIRHISLLEGADVLIIAPATANTIAKMAAGLADNLLTTLYLAAVCPVVIVPSMNINMYEHPSVRENLEKLRQQGCHIMDPEAGELACGVYGKGRMPEPVDIFAFARAVLKPKEFKGIKALVSAGPTREHLDPVRFISNPSSGLMGYALARALQERGAEVILISGPTYLAAPAGVNMVEVTTGDEMYEAMFEHYQDCRLVIKAAAVSDFRPLRVEKCKVKKSEEVTSLKLAKNRDILLELGKEKGSRIFVGFAAETNDAVENAHDKLLRKNLDLIIVNDLKEPGAGFAVTTNRVAIIDRGGTVEELPLLEKEELSHLILDRVASLL